MNARIDLTPEDHAILGGRCFKSGHILGQIVDEGLFAALAALPRSHFVNATRGMSTPEFYALLDEKFPAAALLRARGAA